jgi:PAS domain S-box-containing protein
MPAVVVADADRDTRELYEEYLTLRGWTVATATTGHEGAFLCETRRPDILLTEVALPGIDGIALCRQVRSTSGEGALPILVLTAVSHPHYLVRAKAAGANRLLIKPVPPDVVDAELTHVLQRWPAVLERASSLRQRASMMAAAIASAPGSDERQRSGWELHAATTSDGAGIGALLTDRAGFCVGANPTAADLIGCSRAELLRQSIWDALPPQRRMEARAMWRWFLEAGELGGAVTILTRSGRRRDLQYAAIADVVRGAHLSLFVPHALDTGSTGALSWARG